MRQVTAKQMPAGEPAFEDGFALAGEVEIVEDFEMNTTNPIKSGQAEMLAYVDAVLASVQVQPRRSCKFTASTPWPEYVVDLAKLCGVDAAIVNRGVFLIAERVSVCHADELGRPASEVEPGWNRVKLCSVDGKVRPHDREAPQILISPDERCFIWQPHGDLRKQGRVNFVELCELLGEMGERLAKLEVTL